MNALLLPLVSRSPFAKVTIEHRVDLVDSRIYLETDSGLVLALYVDAKPRRDATIIPLGSGHWHRDAPIPEALKRARLLLESGVSVLFVDVRRHEGWWAQILGCSRMPVIRAAIDYLVARGHDEDDCVVDAW